MHSDGAALADALESIAAEGDKAAAINDAIADMHADVRAISERTDEVRTVLERIHGCEPGSMTLDELAVAVEQQARRLKSEARAPADMHASVRAGEEQTRGGAIGVLTELADLVGEQLTGLQRIDGMHDAVDVDGLRAMCDAALAAAAVHGRYYDELAALEAIADAAARMREEHHHG